MAKTTAGYADLANGKIYYEMAGEGTTLVLNHAGFLDSRMWDEQWNTFTQKYRVIRYDMPGYGQSDPAEKPRNRPADLLHLLNYLHIEHAALLGCSMGGGIITDFALEHPEMVSALIIVSAAPSGFQLQGDPPPHLFEMISASQQGDVPRASELQLRLWIDGPYRQPEQINPLLRQRAGEMNLIPVRLQTWQTDAQPLNPLDPPAIDRLDSIHVPTLILAGALDHPEILRAADVMTDAIQGAKTHIFSNSAHIPNMDEPEAFTQIVMDFLAAVPYNSLT